MWVRTGKYLPEHVEFPYSRSHPAKPGSSRPPSAADCAASGRGPHRKEQPLNENTQHRDLRKVPVPVFQNVPEPEHEEQPTVTHASTKVPRPVFTSPQA